MSRRTADPSYPAVSVRLTAVLLTLLGVMSACRAHSRPAAPPLHLPSPTKAGECGEASDPGRADGGVVGGIEWPRGTRPLVSPAVVYACFSPFGNAIVSITQTGSAASIVPSSAPIRPSSGVLAVCITMTAPGRTRLWLEVRDATTGKARLIRRGPDIVAAGSGWSFARPKR